MREISSAKSEGSELDGVSVRMQDLLQTAYAYSAQAIQSLVAQADGDPQRLRGLFYDYVDLAYRLEIHFLFPNLGDYERGLLVALASARSAIMVGLRNSGQSRSAEAEADHRKALLQLKDKYICTRSEIMSRDLRSHLTPLQQRILEKEFLTIPFNENTTFSRRPEPAAVA